MKVYWRVCASVLRKLLLFEESALLKFGRNLRVLGILKIEGV